LNKFMIVLHLIQRILSPFKNAREMRYQTFQMLNQGRSK